MSCARTMRTLPEMLVEQADERPAAVAIASAAGSITMVDLVRQAARIGTGIAIRNGGSSDCIGLFADASDEMIVAVWGILWSGSGYLPISPDYPEDRIQYLISQSGIDTIITQRHLAARLREIVSPSLRILLIDDLNGCAEELLPASVSPGLAYVIYTSGSTGRPKGVEIEQAAIVNQMTWLRDEGLLRPGDRILQKTPISFDAAQWEILAPAVGATVVAGVPNLYRDMSAITEAIVRYDVSHLQCVPTLLTNLIEDEKFTKCRSLRFIFSGGEPLSQKLALMTCDRVSWARLINLYGPTECTINATAHWVAKSELTTIGKSVAIGRPVAGVSFLILDESMEAVADGEEGELHLGGIQLARGYRNDPEQTAARFISSNATPSQRLYRTGDRCKLGPDGLISFVGRNDHQIKLRGYRIELEEIGTAIEAHPWVRHAAAIVAEDGAGRGQMLIGCVELSDKEAALMDHNVGGDHHRSKADKLQVRAQLSNGGLRERELDRDLVHTLLPSSTATEDQLLQVFARKTYRFFDGNRASGADVRGLLDDWFTRMGRRQGVTSPSIFGKEELGSLLRWMGSFKSEERLLPKFAYASPGALYATQLYVECNGVPGIRDGIHYYDPSRHLLLQVNTSLTSTARIRFHFWGKRAAIEPVYKNNLQEVLEMEVGHMLAVLDEHLAVSGLAVGSGTFSSGDALKFRVASDDLYLGTFDVTNQTNGWRPALDLYLQPQSVIDGMDNGTLKVGARDIVKVSDDIIRRKDVIAINQSIYDRASIGISIVSCEQDDRLSYVALGYGLHQFQRNPLGFGFMASGYSSKSGNPLPASRRLSRILTSAGLSDGPMYFFVGGKLSELQITSRGMGEDMVHMHGPAEIVRDDLKRHLPDYMLPNRLLIFEQLPLSANGKVDMRAIAKSDQLRHALASKPHVVPETPTELKLAKIWGEMLGISEISATDDFFGLGGNSLLAVSMLHRINQEFETTLPVQTLFEMPQLKLLAAGIASRAGMKSSRAVLLNHQNSARPIFCWPGLGGYPMNLRPLAQSLARPFFGIQSYGLNDGEEPLQNIREMAGADCIEIDRLQPHGPITLWGYSFGARVAFEAACQLEAVGREVDQVVLICPGNPVLGDDWMGSDRSARPSNAAFVMIMLSVFIGRLDRALAESCLREAGSFDDIADFIFRIRNEIPLDTIRRIIELVRVTYEFEYKFIELKQRSIVAPITIIKAVGDDYSFVENAASNMRFRPLELHLAADHYKALGTLHAAELAGLITRSARAGTVPLVSESEPRHAQRV